MKKARKKMEKYKTYGFRIAGGNSTLLVEGCPVDQREAYARKQLERFEQVGFIEPISLDSKNLPAMTMMGGEFSVNATLAFARYLEQQTGAKTGELKTSGLETPVPYRANRDVTAKFSIRPRVLEDRQIVLFDGIGYLCQQGSAMPNLDRLRILAAEFKLPAFGIAGYQGNQLTPDVYVKEVDSLVRETACGSGSIALAITTNQRLIYQPTGQKIEVLKSDGNFIVTAQVKKFNTG